MFLRGKPGHVLHQAQDAAVHIVIAEHIHTLRHIGESHLLRGGHNYRAADFDVSYQRDVDIPGSRRHIDEQEVQLAPLHLQNHLLEGIAGHRAAPDQSLVLACKIAYGHPLHPIFLYRDDKLLSVKLFRFRLRALGAGHSRHRRTIDIGIGKADPVAQAGKSYGQIDGHR